MIPVFIGYDPREATAYHVCTNSIIRQSSVPVSFNPLSLNLLSGYEEKHNDGSNHFIYSRFLIPHLMNYKGWALFLDGDMILRDDIAKLWRMRDDSKAVMVVKHDYKTRMTEKYLGAKNENYPRKNWSSVILWNCGHPGNSVVTPEFVQNATGAQVHRFSWLPDNEIGELPIEWNWLPDEFGENEKAKLLHFTLGTPCFHDFAALPMASEWHRERIYMDYSRQHGM
jgi:lipopolysaccharide biosynthesis glycosyltransferase